jgi:hypothetical protein
MVAPCSGARRLVPPARRSVLALAAGLLATLCTPGQAAALRFDPRAFFSGHTEGSGRLKVLFRSGVTVREEGTGHVEADGTLDLAQVVHEGDKPARTRRWRIREIAPGRYTGTISDAAGPMTGDVTGDCLHVTYTSLDGYDYEQWVTVQPDGRSARNVLKVRKLGMTVAEFNETIRQTG